jgi:hypothetical protein
MTVRRPCWLSLAPGTLPETRVYLGELGFDARGLVDVVDLWPLVEVTAAMRVRTDLDPAARYLIDPGRVDDFRFGASCWTFMLATFRVDCIELWDVLGNPDCLAAGDRLIAHLLDRGGPVRWSALSWYDDANQASEVHEGDAAALRARGFADGLSTTSPFTRS